MARRKKPTPIVGDVYRVNITASNTTEVETALEYSKAHAISDELASALRQSQIGDLIVIVVTEDS